MANLKIVCKPEVEGGWCHPGDTKIYLDGILQEDIQAISFGISVDDILSEVHIVKTVQSVEIELDGLDDEDVKEIPETQLVRRILHFAGVETCETCGHVSHKYVDDDGKPAKLFENNTEGG